MSGSTSGLFIIFSLVAIGVTVSAGLILGNLTTTSTTTYVGYTGPQGKQGENGYTGMSGTVGPTGTRGPVGPRPPLTTVGDQGPTGLTGPTGLPGLNYGPTGVTGGTGPTGGANAGPVGKGYLQFATAILGGLFDFRAGNIPILTTSPEARGAFYTNNLVQMFYHFTWGVIAPASGNLTVMLPVFGGSFSQSINQGEIVEIIVGSYIGITTGASGSQTLRGSIEPLSDHIDLYYFNQVGVRTLLTGADVSTGGGTLNFVAIYLYSVP